MKHTIHRRAVEGYGGISPDGFAEQPSLHDQRNQSDKVKYTNPQSKVKTLPIKPYPHEKKGEYRDSDIIEAA